MQENSSQPSRTRPWFLERTAGLEYRFLKGRGHRGADLGSAVHNFLEFLKGFESLNIVLN